MIIGLNYFRHVHDLIKCLIEISLEIFLDSIPESMLPFNNKKN